jgi:hypothetical protein
MLIDLIDTSGITRFSKENTVLVWGRGEWHDAMLGSHIGELYDTIDGFKVFLTSKPTKEDLRREKCVLC